MGMYTTNDLKIRNLNPKMGERFIKLSYKISNYIMFPAKYDYELFSQEIYFINSNLEQCFNMK